jgi:hypothetical protein
MRRQTCRVLVAVALVASLSALTGAHAANYYDGGTQSPGIVVRGGRATITTPPVPLLHGGDFSYAWVMVSNSARDRWAQAGPCTKPAYSTQVRIAGDYTSNDGVHHWCGERSQPSGTPLYTVVQDASTGAYTFMCGSNTFFVTGALNWAGSVVHFYGEVVPDTTVQMMGDTAHPAYFGSLAYKPGSCPSWATAWPDTWRNDQPAQWGFFTETGKFRIWDMSP